MAREHKSLNGPMKPKHLDLATSVLASTIEMPEIATEIDVVPMTAENGVRYFRVRSAKFPTRFYAVFQVAGEWKCNCGWDRMRTGCCEHLDKVQPVLTAEEVTASSATAEQQPVVALHTFVVERIGAAIVALRMQAEQQHALA